jgi:hypothetical protein
MMKVVVYYKNGRPEVFQWTDVHGQACGAKQVLIKNKYISVEGGDLIPDWGEIHMIKDLPPPAEAEECRNTAEILRDLAAHVRVWQHTRRTRHLAENLDRLAAQAERQISRAPV